MKQQNDWSCFAVAACMAVGSSLSAFVDHVGHDGSGHDPDSPHPQKRRGFEWSEVASFLMAHDLFPGLLVSNDPDGGIDEIVESGAVSVSLSLFGRKMLMEVESERLEGCKHMIYWDGGQVFDPSPHTPDGRPLKSYRVTMLIPLIRLK